MLAKNQIIRNKMDNRAKADKDNLDFMPFIQNDINGHIELSNSNKYVSAIEPLKTMGLSDLKE